MYHLPTSKFYSPGGLRQMARIVALARKERVDIIHTFFEKAEVMGWLVRRLAGVPVWVTSRRDLGFKRKPIYDRIFTVSSRHCDSLVAVCQAVKEQTVSREGFPAEKVQVIYNALEDDSLQAESAPKLSRADLGLPAEGLLVGMVANFNFEIKGHRYFIEAAARVARGCNDVHFILVGDGVLRSDCERQAQALGMGGRIHFLGKRGDVLAILRHLDVSVLCSTSEGLSNVIMESMAVGKPVVATRVGGNPELVQEGVTGCLVPPADLRALADAIRLMLDRPDRGKSLGEAGKVFADEKFTIGAMVRAHELLYGDLIAKARN
jgi:glycosyltransferase involved in cell wall biosynthesis